MKPKFVTFNNAAERYLINVNNISSVILHEIEGSGLVITITSIDGSVDEIEILDYEVAKNIFDGIIKAINSYFHMYEIGDVR